MAFEIDTSVEIDSGELDFYSIILMAQNYLTKGYSTLFNEKGTYDDTEEAATARKNKILNIITKFVMNQKIKFPGMSDKDIISKLYDEMVNYSVLTKYVEDKNNEIEEINVNAWNDVEVRYSNGDVRKVEHFYNIEHARNVIERLVTITGGQLDNAMPMAEGDLKNNVRIVVLESPVVDADVGVAASIRLLKPQLMTRKFFIESGTISEEAMTFLELAIRSGVSMVFVGETGSGKTTLMNYLLTTIPNQKRIVTIEHNARELSLVKKDSNGNPINNVIHMKTKPHENEKYNISQEDLVSKALRLDPNNICVGEMRDSEAYAAQEASLTGHTVVTSLHAAGISATHYRIAMLALKKYPIDISVALLQAAMAFPVIIYIGKLEDNTRKVMEIAECELLEDGNNMIRVYSTLYEYVVKESKRVGTRMEINGEHTKKGKVSETLRKTMLLHGAPINELDKI